MSIHYPSSTFYSISGLQRDRFLFEKTGRIQHSVVLTEEDTGVLRAVHLDIARNSDNPAKISIKGHYLLHAGPRLNREEIFLNTSLEEKDGLIILDRAVFLGHDIDVADQAKAFSFVSALNKLNEKVARKHEWPNFIRVFEDNGISTPPIGRKSLPGLYSNGDVKSFYPARKRMKDSIVESEIQEPSYPALFFHAIAGSGPEYYSGQEAITHSFTVRDEQSGNLYIWSYNYKQGKTPGHVEMSCQLGIHSKEGEQVHPLYKLTATPQKNDNNRTAIRQLEVYHPNSGGGSAKIDLTNDKAVSDTLKLIRMYNRTIRAGIEGIEEDFRRRPENRQLYFPTDIMMLTGLTKTLMPAAPSGAKGRFIFTPLGGQNTRETISSYDQHIGGNSYRFDYYPPGEKKPNSIIVDAGALFHDKYDLTMSNIGRYLYHRYDKTHVPETETRMILFTHPHKDHLAQLGYIIKKGYQLPPMIMPPLVLRQLKRDLGELKMDKKIKAEILEKCIVVEPDSIPADAVEGSPHKVRIGKETVSLYWEHLKGDRLGQFERYPVVRMGEFKIRIGPMPHSSPGFMYEIITPAGGQLHTGDFKLDPSLQLYQSPYQPWLDGVASQAVSIDSTGATRDADAVTPMESDIQISVARLFREHADKRFICPVLGSNVARMTTLVAAMGQVGRQYLVVDGKALEDLIDDLESIHGLREWALRVHGVTIAKQGSKAARRIYEEEPLDNYVIAATGTQDEAYSSMNRAIRDWLPEHRFRLEPHDIVVPLQGPIPVGKNQFLRKSARYFAEAFHGIHYILPEEIEKESDYLLSGSGHASPKDIERFYGMVRSCKVSYPIHGGPAQLEAGAAIARKCGLQSIVVGNSEGYETLKNGTMRLFRREVGEMVAIRNQTPTPEQFYLKGKFSTTVVPLKPRDKSEAGVALAGLEEAISEALGADVYNEASQNMGFSLSKTFNMSTGKGYMLSNHAFGIERYDQNVYKAKRIGGYAAFDTETTGTDPDVDSIEQFSVAAWSLEKVLVMEEELVQKISEDQTYHPEALLVTNRDPMEKKEGDHPILFSEKIQRAFKKIKKHSGDSFRKTNPEDYAQDTKARVKTINVAHNLKFDDRFMRELHARTLSERVRPHSTDGHIGLDTRNLARVIHAVYPEKLKVRKKADGKFLDFTLKALCEENGVPYDDEQAHSSALYDSHRAMHLFWKMEEISPDITSQMILNADSSDNHLLDDMSGMDTGFNGPYPVFSYLSPRADRPDIRLGSLVGTVGNGRYAVVMNMAKKGGRDIINLPAKDIIQKIKDPKDDSLELIDLRANPMIMPARFFYARNSVQKYPRETIDRRAHDLKEHLNYVSPDSNWKNISEKIESLWRENQFSIYASLRDGEEPDIRNPASSILKDKLRALSKLSSSNLSLHAHATFNPIAQKSFKKIREYRQAAIEYLESGEADITSVYNQVILYPGLSEDQALLVNHIHYDMKPGDLSADSARKVMEARSFFAAQSALRAEEALVALEGNKERQEQLGLQSEGKRTLFEKIKAYVAVKALLHKFNEDSRLYLHPWRRHRNEGNDLIMA